MLCERLTKVPRPEELGCIAEQKLDGQ